MKFIFINPIFIVYFVTTDTEDEDDLPLASIEEWRFTAIVAAKMISTNTPEPIPTQSKVQLPLKLAKERAPIPR